jgi:hypothetical protein
MNEQRFYERRLELFKDRLLRVATQKQKAECDLDMAWEILPTAPTMKTELLDNYVRASNTVNNYACLVDETKRKLRQLELKKKLKLIIVYQCPVCPLPHLMLGEWGQDRIIASDIREEIKKTLTQEMREYFKTMHPELEFDEERIMWGEG